MLLATLEKRAYHYSHARGGVAASEEGNASPSWHPCGDTLAHQTQYRRHRPLAALKSRMAMLTCLTRIDSTWRRGAPSVTLRLAIGKSQANIALGAHGGRNRAA